MVDLINNAKESKKATFEDAVHLTGYGAFNINILLASGGCLMVVIIETMAMMFIVPASQCDLELTLGTKGILNAISFLGVVSSSHLWGFIADTRGRRKVLIISMLSSFVTSLLSSIIPQAWLFILIRFINGFFVGGASAVVYAYVGEFHDHIYRPKVVSWIATFVAFGNILIPGLAWLILPLDFSYFVPYLEVDFRPWRLLVICYGTPSFLFALWLFYLPESPKYLMVQGNVKEAMEILRYMYSKNSGKNPEDFPVTAFIWDEETEVENRKKVGILKSMWNQTIPLFQKPYLGKTLMVCLLQFGTFASSSGLIMWYPEILNLMANYAKAKPGISVQMCKAIDYHNRHGDLDLFDLEESTIMCNDSVEDVVYFTALIIGALFAIIYITFGIVINAVGAKNLVIGFLVVTTSCGIAAQNLSGQATTETLIGMFLTVATCVGVINAIVVDLFPTQLRAMALAISLMAGRFGAVFGSNITGPLLYQFCDYAFYIYAVDHIILVITIFMLPSPKNSQQMIVPRV